MDGNSRFELTSASPDSNFAGNYQSGQRGYSTSTFGRSSSFREGSESRNVGSSKVNSRGYATSSGDVPTLSQCLMLEPIVMGDPKYVRPGDLRRVLGSSVGSNSEENSGGAAHLKNSPPAAVDELKRYRASVADTCVKASGRAKKFDEHLNKLNKYCEGMPSKKQQQQQRNELSTNEQSSGSTLKIGSQMHKSSSELGSQKFDDRPKNGGLNKRLRTSMTETRGECRNSGVLRQPLMVTKERDMLKDNNADSDVVEEKIRRLPAGGEGWDKKMKRKRSVGAVFSRSVDNDGELKRNMHNKLTIESSLQSSDSSHGFRSGASGGSNKLDPLPSPRITFKNEQDKSVVSRDLAGGPIKERLGKVNVKLNNRDDSHTMSSGPIIKGKASRAPRSGSMSTANSAGSVPRLSGTLESWEQPQPVNRTPTVGGVNNRKRAMPAGSSSPPITQWVGQRPQKISRPRRTNLIPVSNHDEVQMQSEGCSPTDFSPRMSIGGINSPLLSKNAANGSKNLKARLENVPSPARLSESEESGAGENRINDKGLGSRDLEERTACPGQNVGPSAIPIKKNKIMIKEEVGDGVRRQGRSGRVSPFSRASISPNREKLDNVVPTKPLRNARSGSDKNGSKSGRPLKKLSDRKGFSRLGHIANGGSPDCSGESEDDREELLTAANLAFNSSINACSSAFWKTVETLFNSVGPEEKSYLSQQLKLAEESFASLSQNCSNDNSVQMKLDNCNEEMTASESLSCQKNRCVKNDNELKDSTDRREFVEQFQSSSLYGCSDAEKKFNIVTPLYQRVLSALIMEDDIEESEETGFGRPRSSVNDSCLLIGTESKLLDKVDYCEPVFGFQTRKNGNAHKVFPCNGNTNIDESAGPRARMCNGERIQRESGYVHSEMEVLVRLSGCDYAAQNLQANNGGISSFEFQYEQMCIEEKLVLELQSIGMFVEAVPALDDKEDEMINQEIVQLEKGLHDQIGKKKTCLDKIYKGIQEGKGTKRDPEQVAIDRLVELAYKKLLATRISFASKHGIPKVSKQVALAFAKRTLARCRKFEDLGTSCFSDPALREIVYAPPPRFAETELLSGVNLTVANDGGPVDPLENSIHLSDQAVAKNGPLSSNRGKKREVLLDDVGGAVFRASSALGTLGGAKGKRSERDTSGKNAVAKAGRLAVGGSKGERKTKSKPKQRTAQLSTSGNAFAYPSASGSGESANNSGSRKKDVRFMSSSRNAPSVSSKEMKESVELTNLPLNDIDGIEELGVDSEIEPPQDLNSWFNFDVDGLQDHDSVGLEIPMDDLSELNMF